MNQSSQVSLGYMYVIASGLLFGCLGYFGKHLMDLGLSVSTMLMWRFFISACTVLGFLILTKSTSILLVEKTAVFLGILLGALLYAPSTMCYFVSSKYVGTGVAMVLLFSFPPMVVFINALAEKKFPDLRVFYCSVILILGLSFLGMHDGKFDLIGVITGLGSAFFYAVYIFFSKGLNSRLSPLTSTFLMACGCILSFFIFSLQDNTLVVPTDMASWKLLVGFGILCTFLPVLFLLKGLEKISASKASFLSVFEPLVNVLFGVYLLGEQLSLLQGAGILLVLGAAIFA